MEVIRQDSLTLYRVTNDFKQSNTYLLEIPGSENLWLFDIGDSTEIYQLIGSRRVEGVFLTHCHLDHIAGIVSLKARFPRCRLYGHEKCLAWLSDDRRNLSYYYGSPLCFLPDNCITLSDGAMVALCGGVEVEAMATPGHSEDSMSYLIGDTVVTGDAFIPNVPPVTKLKGGDRAEYERSRAKILSRLTPGSCILPGHGMMYRGLTPSKKTNEQ